MSRLKRTYRRIFNQPNDNFDELINLNNETFITEIYKKLLLREPTTEEIQNQLKALRLLKVGKVELISYIHDSPEGKIRNVRLRGLKQRIYIIKVINKIPVLRTFIRYFQFSFRLLKYLRHLPSVIVNIDTKINQIDISISQLHDTLDKLIRKYDDDVEKNRISDDLYLNFENIHRGKTKSVTDNQKDYLKILGKSKDSNICDIGCGRGEWLTLLKKKNFNAFGVEINQKMVELCKKNNLNVNQSDGLEFLNNQPEKIFTAITAFHVVEHFTPAKTIQFFKESFRTLKEKGIILFETPNPENMIVGSSNFYTDPTHTKPIPPALMKFYAKQTGFKKIRIVKKHPLEFGDHNNVSDPNMQLLLSKLREGQDYCIIAQK